MPGSINHHSWLSGDNHKNTYARLSATNSAERNLTFALQDSYIL